MNHPAAHVVALIQNLKLEPALFNSSDKVLIAMVELISDFNELDCITDSALNEIDELKRRVNKLCKDIAERDAQIQVLTHKVRDQSHELFAANEELERAAKARRKK